MKRFNSQSLNRQVKRGHVRFIEHPFVKNEDGSSKIIKQVKTKRGFWTNN